MHRKGLLGPGWEEYYDFFNWKPVAKPAPSFLTPKGAKTKTRGFFAEFAYLAHRIYEKTDPNADDETEWKKVLSASKGLTTRKIGQPGMYFRQGHKKVKDPLEALPLVITFPVRAVENVWEYAVDFSAGTIKTFVIAPVKVSRTLYSRIKRKLRPSSS